MLTVTSHSPSLLSSASHLSQICEQRETINSDNYVADLGLARDSTVGADDPTSTDRMSLMAVEADRGRGWIADRLLIDFGFYEPCQVSHDQYRGSESVSPKKSLVKIGEPSHTRRFASEKGLRKGSFRQTGLNLDIRLGSCVSAMGSSPGSRLPKNVCTTMCWRSRSPTPDRPLECLDVPIPEPRSDEFLIRAHAIGVGMPDVLIRAGTYNFMPPLPAVPGQELSGTIERVGANARTLTERDVSHRGEPVGLREAPQAVRFLRHHARRPPPARWTKTDVRESCRKGSETPLQQRQCTARLLMTDF
jgi:hypothetical protein